VFQREKVTARQRLNKRRKISGSDSVRVGSGAKRAKHIHLPLRHKESVRTQARAHARTHARSHETRRDETRRDEEFSAARMQRRRHRRFEKNSYAYPRNANTRGAPTISAGWLARSRSRARARVLALAYTCTGRSHNHTPH